MNLENVKKMLGDRFSFAADDVYTAIQSVKLPESAYVLDVGTGIGNMAIMLALHGYQVVTGEPAGDDSVYAGQDWQANAVKAGVRRLIRFEPFDAVNMPFEKNAFDGVFALGSLHHVLPENRFDVMRECVRTAKAGACICFLEPREKLIRMIQQRDPAHPPAADPSDYIKGLHLNSMSTTGKLFHMYFFKTNNA
ncbi:MAG: class I SAM-dependent methyltransferase [Desulfobacterales bacterium]